MPKRRYTAALSAAKIITRSYALLPPKPQVGIFHVLSVITKWIRKAIELNVRPSIRNVLLRALSWKIHMPKQTIAAITSSIFSIVSAFIMLSPPRKLIKQKSGVYVPKLQAKAKDSTHSFPTYQKYPKDEVNAADGKTDRRPPPAWSRLLHIILL